MRRPRETSQRVVELLYANLEHGKHVVIDEVELPHELIIDLIDRARVARKYSYAPYSNFNVGAALLGCLVSGNEIVNKEIYTGCNVENASYGLSMCAERTATFKAVSNGYRLFEAIAVVGSFDYHVDEMRRGETEKDIVTPCGACRQVLFEFGCGDMAIIMASDTGKVAITLLRYLLPKSFGPETLGMIPSTYSRR